MNEYKIKTLAAALLFTAAGHGAIADEQKTATSFEELVSEGTAAVDFRYRYETVDEDGFEDNAKGGTLRSRLTLTTAVLHGFSGQLEADNVSNVGPDDYNSTENGKTQYPVIADPEGTDLNQAWIQYKNDLLASKLGRQRILLGEERFVGGVGWRQNEQTYDGFRNRLTPLAGLAVDFSYVDKVHRIFGPDDGVFPSELKGDNYFLRSDYAITENHKVAAFGYIIDVNDQSGYPAGKTVNMSSDTYGVTYSGKLFDTLTLAATYAGQSDGGDSQLHYDTDYYMAEVGVTVVGVTIKGAYEVLASDNDVGFQTPYATLHKFQGWADKFLVTPGAGIEDANVSIGGKLGPVALGATYHDFQAEFSSEDWGSEVDLVVTWPVLSYLSLQAKYANFNSDSDAYQDTEKLWLTMQLKL
jgi:hypothetical protein